MVQNVEIGVVWGSYVMVISNVAIRASILYRFRAIPVIYQKSPILSHPTCLWRPSRGWPKSNFAEIFGIRKLESMGYRVVLFASYV